jgi:hypothetical protein
MDPRIIDILRYSVIIVVLLVASLFFHKHYSRYVTKKEIVAEMQSVTSDSSFYRQFEADDAQATLLRSIALIHQADELGLPLPELMDRVFNRNQSEFFEDTPSSDHPIKEELVENALTSAYEAARRLEILDSHSVSDLRDGRMPITPAGSPVILPLIDPELSPGLEKIIPNLEILPPDRAGKTRELSSIETAAARKLAKDLSSARLIEDTIAERIIEHYKTKSPEEVPETK